MNLLKLPAVCQKVGLSKARIYTAIRGGTFPKPVKIGQSAVAWPEHEVNNWIAERIAERDAGGAKQ